MKVVINRRKWLRGHKSPLASSSGCMCALGFLGEACGIPVSRMKRTSGPAEQSSFYPEDFEKWPKSLVSRDSGRYYLSTAGSTIITVNDNAVDEDIYREPHLVQLFKDIGLELEFVG